MGRFVKCATALMILLTSCMAMGVSEASAKTVGVIMTGDIKYYQDIHAAFMAGMKGSGVEVVVQTPVPEPMAWANAARKLATIGSDVIVSYGAPATLSAMKATPDIPIIFAGVYMPDEMNITGKNATGVSSTVMVEEVLSDMLAIKGFKHLGVVFNKSEKDTILQARDIKKLEGKLGYETTLLSVEGGVKKDALSGLDAVLFTSSCAGMTCIISLGGFTQQDRILTGATISGAEDLGIVLTVNAGADEQGSIAASMVRAVLGGKKISDIPVANPRVIHRVVNLRHARSIGLTVPDSVLKSATRVIK